MFHVNGIIQCRVFCDWLLSALVFKVHPYCGIYQNFVPFYYPTIFHYMTVPHFTDEDLGGFQFWPLRENTPVNVCVCLYRVSFPFLSGVYLGVEWLGHRVPMLKVWGTAKLLSRVATPFYIPTHRT